MFSLDHHYCRLSLLMFNSHSSERRLVGYRRLLLQKVEWQKPLEVEIPVMTNFKQG